MSDELADAVFASHLNLTKRLEATTLCSYPQQARDQHARTDAFLIAACRHVSAVSTLLAGEVSRLGREEQSRTLVTEYHALLLAMLRAKGRLCGASQLARTSWPKTWTDVVDRVGTLMALEREAVIVLTATHAPQTLEGMALNVMRRERTAPTRPHPFIPTKGLTGRFASSLCSRLDVIWDSLEGRQTARAPLAATAGASCEGLTRRPVRLQRKFHQNSRPTTRHRLQTE